MKVLIIEDEHMASQRLVRTLEAIDSSIVVLDTIESVESATNWFIHHPLPDLVFMDVQLEDGLCFEIFDHVKISIPVIFTTAFDAYALQAFKVNSVDYLLKPVEAETLRNALQKFRLIHYHDDAYAGMQGLFNQLKPHKKERFLIRVGEHYKSIQVSDICCFFIRERCSFILTGNGRSYAIDHSLEQVEKMIDAKTFFRVNRNAIVNFHFIRDIVAYSSNRLKIQVEGWTDKEDILVSRERVAAFKAWMDR